MYDCMVKAKKSAQTKKNKNTSRRSFAGLGIQPSEKVTYKRKHDLEYQQEVEDYLQPKIDVHRSLKNQQIVFQKSPGMKIGEQGELIPRTLIGTQGMMDEALVIKEEKVRQQQFENQKLLGLNMQMQSAAEREPQSSTSVQRKKTLVTPTQEISPERQMQNQLEVAMGGIGQSRKTSSLNFSFGRKKKTDDDKHQEISGQMFEYLCYEATKRVQENSDFEQMLSQQKFNKVNPEQLNKNYKHVPGNNILAKLKNMKIQSKNKAITLNDVKDPFLVPTVMIDKIGNKKNLSK